LREDLEGEDPIDGVNLSAGKAFLKATRFGLTDFESDFVEILFELGDKNEAAPFGLEIE
jgi:hypothetical protein